MAQTNDKNKVRTARKEEEEPKSWGVQYLDNRSGLLSLAYLSLGGGYFAQDCVSGHVLNKSTWFPHYAALTRPLPLLRAKKANIKIAFHLVTFLMSKLLSTPQTEAAALSTVPLGSGLSWKCCYLQVRDEDQTRWRLYYSWKISAWPHDSWEEKGAMFTAAPHCNFQGRESVT